MSNDLPTYSAVWGTDADGEEVPLTTELISGGTINELAQAASDHGVMITISFIPATEDEEP